MMQEKPLYRIGMVFGVFDGFHQGHQYFLDTATKQCEKLIVVVALSEVVELIKKHTPRFTYEERIASIRAFNPKLEVVPSDKTLGEWKVLKEYSPQMILLGHDQLALACALDIISTPYIILDAYYPEKYKSSLLHKD